MCGVSGLKQFKYLLDESKGCLLAIFITLRDSSQNVECMYSQTLVIAIKQLFEPLEKCLLVFF